MTFTQAQYALQLLAEEAVGAPQRRAILEAKALEDRAAAAAADAWAGIAGGEPGSGAPPEEPMP